MSDEKSETYLSEFPRRVVDTPSLVLREEGDYCLRLSINNSIRGDVGGQGGAVGRWNQFSVSKRGLLERRSSRRRCSRGGGGGKIGKGGPQLMYS